jgi:hypothetical protein
MATIGRRLIQPPRIGESPPVLWLLRFHGSDANASCLVRPELTEGHRSSASATAAYEFTSQLFFDDALTDRVHAQQPYAVKGQRDLRNSGENAPPAGGAFASLTGAEQR